MKLDYILSHLEVLTAKPYQLVLNNCQDFASHIFWAVMDISCYLGTIDVYYGLHQIDFYGRVRYSTYISLANKTKCKTGLGPGPLTMAKRIKLQFDLFKLTAILDVFLLPGPAGNLLTQVDEDYNANLLATTLCHTLSSEQDDVEQCLRFGQGEGPFHPDRKMMTYKGTESPYVCV